MRNLFSLPLLLFFLLALASPTLAQLSVQGAEQVISYSGATAFVLTNIPVNPNLLVTTGTNTFIMNVNPPTNSARVYITNDTANACSNITVSLASTGNGTLNSFNNNTGAWQTINVQTGSGAFGATQPITLPASGTVAVTSSAIIGTKIALFVVLSSGCATTNVDVQVVFGTFSPTNSQVQGVVAVGAPASGVDPLLIGTKDSQTGVAALAESVNPNTETSVTSRGLSVGGADESFESTLPDSVREPAGGPDGPLLTAIVAPAAGNNGGNSTQAHTVAQSNYGSGNTGLFTSDAGVYTKQSATVGTNTTLILWNSPPALQQGHSTVETCHFTLNVTSITGTGTTADFYVQDSGDGTLFDDRIHFNQFTTGGGGGVQIAGIAGSSANGAVHAQSSTAITAGTVVSGPLGPIGRVNVVLGGGTPSVTFFLQTYCK